jgi:hypothetical protein
MFHNHELNKKITKDLNQWFNKKHHDKFDDINKNDAKFINSNINQKQNL